MARKAAIAIGVGKAGTLPSLEAAGPDARRFAEWAKGNDYADVRLITDEAGPVTLKDIADAVKAVIAEDPDRLLLFFSGHGTGSATGEYWLLSNYDSDSNEAVNVLLSFNNAKRLPVRQIGVFADACRSVLPDAAYINGGSIFPRVQVAPQRMPKWDHFFATRLSDIAQEVPGQEDRAAYGVFSRCLFNALSGKERSLFERRTDPRQSDVICSDKLADWLDETIPLESGKIPGARVQFPDTSAGWRRPDDIYLEIDPAVEQTAAFKDLIDGINFERFSTIDVAITKDLGDRIMADRRWGSPSRDSAGSRADEVRPAPPERRMAKRASRRVPGKRDTAVERTVAPTSRQAGSAARARVDRAKRDLDDRIRRSSEAMRGRGRQHFETGQGLTIHGTEIIEVVAADGAELFHENGAQHVRGRSYDPQSIVLRLASGDWFATVILPEFVGVATFVEGAAVSFNYQPIGRPPDEGVDRLLRRWNALMNAGRAPRGELREIGNLIRWGKHGNPALGLLAAYAYERAGEIDEIDSIVGFFAKRWQPVLFDLAILSSYEARLKGGQISFEQDVRHESHLLRAVAAGTFPLLGRGWSMLDAEDPAVHPELPRLRAGLRPSLWTLLRAEEGARLAGLVRAGEL